MIIDSYDINSEPIVKLENFYGEKQHLVKKCMVIFSKVIYEYMLEKFPCRQIAEVRAVSYTHLDVYKRQLHASM